MAALLAIAPLAEADSGTLTTAKYKNLRDRMRRDNPTEMQAKD
jgi:hypothetical protein